MFKKIFKLSALVMCMMLGMGGCGSDNIAPAH